MDLILQTNEIRSSMYTCRQKVEMKLNIKLNTFSSLPSPSEKT